MPEKILQQMNDEEGQVHNGVGLLILPSLGPVTLQCSIYRSGIPMILRTFATRRGADRCAVCHRTLLSFWCLCLSSEERQLTLSSVPLITSVVALSQHDGWQDSFVSKVRAHFKEARSPNEDDTSLSCQYPITSPQPSSAYSAHSLHSPDSSPRGRRQQKYEWWWPSASKSKWQRLEGNDTWLRQNAQGPQATCF